MSDTLHVSQYIEKTASHRSQHHDYSSNTKFLRNVTYKYAV